jgi:hypothetical protein
MPTQMSPLMRACLDDATRKLSGRFRGVFSEETVAQVVEDSYAAGSAADGRAELHADLRRAVRRIRYDIHHHVTDLLESLNVPVTPTLPST